MGALQDEVNRWTHELPRQNLTKMIEKKLDEHGIILSKMRLDKLVSRLIAGEEHMISAERERLSRKQHVSRWTS